MDEPRKLKRVVIKEELFALTGDFKEAIILNQFIYWSERIRDFDKFVEEENKRRQMETGEEPIELNNGWIFKSVKELKEEIMINLSESNLSKYINNLVEKEFLSKRRNPKYKWDKTFQYRVNLKYIQISLNKLGYCLEGYKDARFSRISVLENGNSVLDNHNSQNRRAIPEITSDITYRDYSKKSPINIGVPVTTFKDEKDFIDTVKKYTEDGKTIHLSKIIYNGFKNRNYEVYKMTKEQEENYIKATEYILEYINCVEDVEDILYKYFERKSKYYSIVGLTDKKTLGYLMSKSGLRNNYDLFADEQEFKATNIY